MKGVLGLFWSIVTYVVRIYLNLLVEPQLNPIKHFPVVTVAAKIMLPFALRLTRFIALTLTPFVGSILGGAFAAMTVFFLPGVFGFLVWELCSNWRLYAANRSESLRPVIVGGHGETVVRLLRPGFHSGTLPKLFGRLRGALEPGHEGKALRNREALHHVGESVRRLVGRELAALLHESRQLRDLAVEPGTIRLATNRIRIELMSKNRDRQPLRIDLEEGPNVLTARVSRPGWRDGLCRQERQTLEVALAGFYKMCGVELVRTSPGPLRDCRVADAGEGEPGLSRETLAFANIVISWRQWVEVWQDEAVGGGGKDGSPWKIDLSLNK